MWSGCFGHQMSGFYLDITLASSSHADHIHDHYSFQTNESPPTRAKQQGRYMHHNLNRREFSTSIKHLAHRAWTLVLVKKS